MREVDIVVVGAGVMGSATAWRLAQAGREVVVLDAFAIGHTRGSSHGASRIFRVAYDDPDYSRLARRARDGWAELEAATGDRLLEVTGGVDYGDPGTVERVVSVLRDGRHDVEELDAAEAGRRWPALRFDSPVAYSPDTGRVYADRAVTAFQREAARHGAELRFGTTATAVTPGASTVDIVTDDETYRARTCVVTAGAWVTRLLGGVVALPRLLVTREQPAFFRPRDPATRWPAFIQHGPAGAVPGGYYGLDSPGEGVKVGQHLGGAPTDPDDDPPPDASRLRELIHWVERWAPGLHPEPVAVTTCLYTTTPTHDFVVDRAGPVVVGSPCSGHGFKFAPEIGRLLATLATGGDGVPDRFALPRVTRFTATSPGSRPHMTDINVLPMGPHEFAVDVREGDITKAHRVSVSEGIRDALVGVADEEERLVRESIAVFLDHKEALVLPENTSLDWIADTIPDYFDEVRARLT